MKNIELMGTYYIKVCMFDGFDVLIEAKPDWDIQWLIGNFDLIHDAENAGDYLIRLSTTQGQY